jgi:trans-aconitate methyltransferase
MDSRTSVSVQTHWDNAYSSKGVNDRSWSESGESDSLDEFDSADLSSEDGIIDVGGGASTFVKSLVQRGYNNVTVLDVSQTAIDEAKLMLGDKRESVKWIVSDVVQWEPTEIYAYWNDRAVFHFLVDKEDQQAYVGNVMRSTRSGSHIVIATFSPDGPESCSGLQVQRWSQKDLSKLFADSCSVVRSGERNHVTPWGLTQSFTWVHLLRN